MKSNKMKVGGKAVAMALLLMAAGQGNVSASDRFGGAGQVNFSGKIYQPACLMQTNGAAVTSECFQQGKMRQQTLQVSASKAQAFNDNRADVKMTWLNDDKRIGMLTVIYR